jgi:hypothetical protein
METRDIHEIQQRVEEVSQKLKTIEAAMDKEFERDFFSRRVDVFRFLESEKKMYTAILKELNWVIRV